MRDYVLLGRGRQVQAVPQEKWKQHLVDVPEHSRSMLRFMTEAHHQVRYFVVRELAQMGRPIEPGFIAERLKLPLGQVGDILDELEKKLFFLARNEQRAVSWAYPVTVEPTPHRLNFSTGERLYGA
jgi:hypothetical protein